MPDGVAPLPPPRFTEIPRRGLRTAQGGRAQDTTPQRPLGPAIDLDEVCRERVEALPMHGEKGAPLNIHDRGVTTGRTAAALKGSGVAGRIFAPCETAHAECWPCGLPPLWC